jgi:ABC-type transport system involved in Fe-S cluster assembly fused permease/ATPase subunit
MLLDRFYDLTSGSLSLEEKDIKSLNLPLVRSHLGIVSQVRHSSVYKKRLIMTWSKGHLTKNILL